jgi:hypothetical protein
MQTMLPSSPGALPAAFNTRLSAASKLSEITQPPGSPFLYSGPFSSTGTPSWAIPFVWHATHSRSKATPGTPDFFVGVSGHAMWIEFKRDRSCHLTQEQEAFRLASEAQHIEHYVVYSAGEAIELIRAV